MGQQQVRWFASSQRVVGKKALSTTTSTATSSRSIRSTSSAGPPAPAVAAAGDETESSSSSAPSQIHTNNPTSSASHSKATTVKMMLAASVRNLYHNPHSGGPPKQPKQRRKQQQPQPHLRQPGKTSHAGETPPASPHPSPNPTPRPTLAAANSVRSSRFRLSRDRALPSIPQLGIFHSNHVLVNKERATYRLPPYKRCRDLDELARQHAKAMADQSAVYHSVRSIQELQGKLQSGHVAENVQCGDTIKQMHEHVMAERQVSCQNILGNFDEFGMATAKGSVDGKLYLCQLFRR